MIGVGKYERSATSHHGSAGSADAVMSAVRVIFAYASSTASSGEVSPIPAASRASITASVGRYSIARSSSPDDSSAPIIRRCTVSRACACRRALPSAMFWR